MQKELLLTWLALYQERCSVSSRVPELRHASNHAFSTITENRATGLLSAQTMTGDAWKRLETPCCPKDQWTWLVLVLGSVTDLLVSSCCVLLSERVNEPVNVRAALQMFVYFHVSFVCFCLHQRSSKVSTWMLLHLFSSSLSYCRRLRWRQIVQPLSAWHCQTVTGTICSFFAVFTGFSYLIFQLFLVLFSWLI